MTGHWNRDLALDLDKIGAWGARAIVTLLEPRELIDLRVKSLGDEVRRRHMQWVHLPIRDGSVPDQEFETHWGQRGEELRAMLCDGHNILIHCRGGLGRAGTISARLLIELGMHPAEAIGSVRVVRKGAIDTSEQERFLYGLTRDTRNR